MFARRTLLRALGVVVALCAAATSARADTVSIGESTLPGIFTGTVSVTGQTTTSAVITVQLTNISPAANGGYITGLAFNDPNSTAGGNIGNVASSVTLSTAYVPSTGQVFSLLGGPTSTNPTHNFSNDVATSPYGNFDIAATVGGSWTGGGMPQDGLAVGETGTFVFNVTGTSLQNLSAANLLAAMSSNGSAGFAVRFRGFNDGSSDKDIAGVICYPPPPPPPPPPPGAVPAPPGLVLAGMGFGCMLLGRLRFRRK